MLYLNKNVRIGAEDNIIVRSGSKVIKAIVLNSGEGEGSLFEDEFYWLHAPSKGVQYPLSVEEPPELHSQFLLARVDMSDIPFSKLPEKVAVQKKDNEGTFNFKVTAVIGLSVDEGGYLIYLEFEK